MSSSLSKFCQCSLIFKIDHDYLSLNNHKSTKYKKSKNKTQKQLGLFSFWIQPQHKILTAAKQQWWLKIAMIPCLVLWKSFGFPGFLGISIVEEKFFWKFFFWNTTRTSGEILQKFKNSRKKRIKFSYFCNKQEFRQCFIAKYLDFQIYIKERIIPDHEM